MPKSRASSNAIAEGAKVLSDAPTVLIDTAKAANAPAVARVIARLRARRADRRGAAGAVSLPADLRGQGRLSKWHWRGRTLDASAFHAALFRWLFPVGARPHAGVCDRGADLRISAGAWAGAAGGSSAARARLVSRALACADDAAAGRRRRRLALDAQPGLRGHQRHAAKCRIDYRRADVDGVAETGDALGHR